MSCVRPNSYMRRAFSGMMQDGVVVRKAVRPWLFLPDRAFRRSPAGDQIGAAQLETRVGENLDRQVEVLLEAYHVGIGP